MNGNGGRVFKPTRSLTAAAQMYRKWSDWEESDYIIGTYVNKVIDNYDKNNYIFKVEEAHFMDNSGSKYEGKTLGLNHCGSLAKIEDEKLPYGTMMQITYTGKVVISKGKYAGKDAHTLDIQVGEMGNSYEDEEDVEL